MTAEAAATTVTRTECVVRYTLPTPVRAPLATVDRAAVFGPPAFRDCGLLEGGVTGTGVELPTVTPEGHGAPTAHPYLFEPRELQTVRFEHLNVWIESDLEFARDWDGTITVIIMPLGRTAEEAAVRRMRVLACA